MLGHFWPTAPNRLCGSRLCILNTLLLARSRPLLRMHVCSNERHDFGENVLELMKRIFGAAMFAPPEESSTRQMVGLLEQFDKLPVYQVQLRPQKLPGSHSFRRRASN